jgi:hypothetical protein
MLKNKKNQLKKNIKEKKLEYLTNLLYVKLD